jgi:CRISPR-associated endonuclease/helicase Cas3
MSNFLAKLDRRSVGIMVHGPSTLSTLILTIQLVLSGILPAANWFGNCAAFFQPPAVPHPPADAALNIFLTLLSGLVSVADWLGSRDDDYSFPLIKEVITTREYAERSQAQAKRVLHDLGWTGWQANHKLLDFSTMFQYLDEEKKVAPRPIQQEIIDITAELAAPSLIIIEAPTGIGKTEIALYLADTLLQKHRGRGLYIAMPTQATSNQMFDRAAEFLRQRYPENMVNLHLAHGQAAFDERIQTITLRTIGDNKKDDPIVAMSWFNQYSKRTLLAPFGVGTVDQTLMSVLQTKHFFVRLLGLSHKVVVFDEVHAYDAYLGTLFQQLLQWLRAIGTSVIMLSATLPAETRRKFVDAYTGQRPQLDSHYPVITIASAEKPAEIRKLPSPNNITLEIEWKAVEEQIDHILSLGQKGGCIAVICNTVGRAQVTFRQLLEAWETGQLDIERDNLILFHARFPPIWRKAIEEKTKKLFGKPQKDSDGKEVDYRPQTGPVIIVATQVIEQSLDLDFDAMITDLAPIDLLIQRAGRLHRHEIRDSQRHGHARQLTIIKPKLDDQEIPHFGSDEYIYERYVLLRTYRALEHQANKNRLTLPGQTIDLIEAVYDASDPFLDDETNWQVALKKAHQKMRRDRHESQQKAKTQLAGTPDDEMLLYETNLGLEEDNPAVHHTMRTQTRDIGPTLSLICLHATEQEDRVTLDPEDATATIDLKSPPDSALVRELLQRRINVQHWALLNHFLSENPAPKSAPSAWRENSTLHYMRAVIFQDGEYRFADEKNEYVLSLNRDYGLELKYQVKEV